MPDSPAHEPRMRHGGTGGWLDVGKLRARRRGAAARRTEKLLLRRFAMTRSPQVREELVARFMPLAHSLAKRYRGGSEPFEDLIQVASLGLLKAIDGYDPDRGGSFTAYAVPTILGELRRHFRDHTWSVHLPRGAQELTMQVDEAVSKLSDENGRLPTVAEIAERLGIGEEEVLEARRAKEARRARSLDAPRPRGDGDLGPLVESVPSVEPGYDRIEAEAAARSAGLDDRDWKVLRLRFVEDLNQYEIGRRLGVSQMQISRIMRRALNKLLASVRGEPEDSEGS